MMIAGSDVTLTAILVNNGAPFTAAAVQMRVTGPGGAVLQDYAPVTPIASAAGSMTIVVPAALNQLGAGVTQEARVVDLQMTSTAFSGTATVRLDYVLNASMDVLQVMVNSFQTYEDALVVAANMTDIADWTAARYDDRVRAMQHAYRTLSHINFEIYYDRDDIYFKSRASWGLPWINTIGNLYNYSATDFQNLDPDFRKGIYMAQVVESDELLGGPDPTLNDREMGIMQTVTGDTSRTYRRGKPLSFGISRRALKYLTGYVKFTGLLIRS